MDESVKRCDQCGERQLSANNWIRYRDPPAGDFIVKRKWGKLSSTYTHKDACGHSCVIKAFSTWLAAVHVNKRTEVKKDEAP